MNNYYFLWQDTPEKMPYFPNGIFNTPMGDSASWFMPESL
jgi:hypothetical protein